MKRALILFAILVLGIGAGLWIKVNENQAAALAPSGGNGVIEGLDVDVSSRMPGRITAIRVQEGDRVKAGQVLVELDCREPRAAWTAAGAQLRMAQINVEASRAQVDAALGASRAASAAVHASGAQSRAARVSQAATSRQEQRVRQLKKVGGVTEVELDKVSTQVLGLNQQIAALDARTQGARPPRARARWRFRSEVSERPAQCCPSTSRNSVRPRVGVSTWGRPLPIISIPLKLQS